ncbi:ABC transporter substrate-binding protein [Deferribacter autotrophicus]|uniref:ABC transporter substrate-binding protein n=2 Tax=Deferribacter autotrophicus TaxID=500465 RepID=A0A5A8F545_9BACT|nr:ABC transporter substrate-binding protein [Deferribacter autotrophicus]
MSFMFKSLSKIASFFMIFIFLISLVNSSVKAEVFKLGVVTFLSGAAAGPFGVPAKNAADLVVDAINKGKLPAPYNSKGFAGMKIIPVVIDEAGGTTKQVAEFKNLVLREKVDAVVGYISSGDCLAIAPVADELGTITVFFDCGTHRIFEENSYKYVFRTGTHSAIESIALARYLIKTDPNLKYVSAINQNYSWGIDSWNEFSSALKTLKPDIEFKAVLFPKLFAGQYGAEISTLMSKPAQYIHSSFWGGDMEAFILQASARGLFKKQTPILSCGETAMFRLKGQMPEGAILGAGRGRFGVYAPDNELNRWFRKNFIKKYGIPPTYPAYKMAQAILGLKYAVDKAGVKDKEKIVKAFEYAEFEAPSGKVYMRLGKGHQAVQEIPVGKFTKKDGKPSVKDVVIFSPECVSPPDGVKTLDWINQGFPGAKCN